MREFHILNLGAGVQSTCLYLLSREPESKIHFDVAIFADTGEEPDSVYNHLNWLQSLGSPKILIKTVGDSLGNDLLYGYKKMEDGLLQFLLSHLKKVGIITC